MTFNSLAFAAFLPIVLGVYYLLNRRAQNVWLLAASWLFYGWWDLRFLALLGYTTVVDYACARLIDRSTDPRWRRVYLMTTLASNLLVLGFFKYFNFFVDSAQRMLEGVGLGVSMPALRIILPVGISFYTFQTMAYAVDVYRGKLPACRSLLNFALFVSYFPQLVAGPIERATSLLPQLERDRRVTWQHLREGSLLILIGLFKKIAVADALAPLVDLRFQNPVLYGGSDLLFAVYLFSIQIYCDFSGYSDIARGTSKLVGVDLMLNFNHPLFARSIADFWRRWHISLSNWLRDYLYIPLGGNRYGVRNTYRNLMLTMLLGGLWHGANWTFVTWGGVHGVYLSAQKWWRDRRISPVLVATGGRFRVPSFGLGLPNRLRLLVQIFITFNLVALTRIFFRAEDFAEASTYLMRLFTWQPAGPLEALNWIGLRVTLLLAVLLGVDLVQHRAAREAVFLEWHWSARGALYATLVVVMLVCGGLDGDVPFIYFQF